MYEVLMRAQNIHKSYAQGVGELKILQGISIDIFKGESLGIVGSSGCGKSTLLHILGTLDQPQLGSLSFAGTDLWQLSDEELAAFRNHRMGFVFQFHHLLSEFSAVENVMIPLRISGEDPSSAREKAIALLTEVGLVDRADHFPNQLSGGELQRVAIARALIQSPDILFADEPTGNLDSKNSLLIQNLFFDLQARRGLTLVVVTHDAQFASRFSRVQRMSDGKWV
jgi:lipoprotein-releasing system ATP-binding protein